MPTLAEEANKRVQNDLNSAVVEEFIQRGTNEISSLLDFKSMNGSAYEFVLEVELPGGQVALDPYGRGQISNDSGRNETFTVTPGYLAKHADTATRDVYGKTPKQGASQQMDDVLKATKKVYRVFLANMIYGQGQGNTLKGFEYWIDTLQTALGDEYEAGADANGSNLSATHLDDLLSKARGDKYDVIISDRETKNEYRAILRALGGTGPEQIMPEGFNQSVFAYDGIPWITFDPVGMAKVSLGSADMTGGETTLTVDDSGFVGFSSVDVGRDVTVGDHESTIASVTDNTTVELEDAAPSDISGANFRGEKINVIYAARFDENDGFCAVYHNTGGQSADAGEYYGGFAGFANTDLGLLENDPYLRRRIEWHGNFACQKSDAVARLTNFNV